MGGRGSAFRTSGGFKGYDDSGTGAGFVGIRGGQVRRINVAGMTPSSNGTSLARTDVRTTLQSIEKKSLSLDKEQLKVIDDDGFVTLAYQGGKHSVAFDQVLSRGNGTGRNSSYETTRDKIVTHNHPSAYGGTLSEADVSNFLRLGQKEIRASAKEGTYSLKKIAGRKQNPSGFNNAYAKDQRRLHQVAVERATKVVEAGGSSVAFRKAYCDVYSQWYKANAPKYGYSYTFKRNKGYTVS